MLSSENNAVMAPILPPQIDALLTHQEAEEFLRLARIEVQSVPSYIGRIQTRPELFDTEHN